MNKKFLFYSSSLIIIITVITYLLIPEELSYFVLNVGTRDEVIQIRGMRDRNVQNIINKKIKEDFDLYFKDYRIDLYMEPLYCGVIDDQYLGIVMQYTADQRMGQFHYFRLIYNIKSGERVYLDDIFDISKEFIIDVMDCGEEHTYDLGQYEFIQHRVENMNYEEYEKYLKNISMTQEEWNRSGNISYEKPDFFITDKFLFLDVTIPLEKIGVVLTGSYEIR